MFSPGIFVYERGGWRRASVIGAALAIGVALAMVVATARAETLRFACNHFPPHKIDGPPGTPQGIDTDIIRLVTASVGDKAEFEFLPWRRALVSALNGTMDAVCTCRLVEGERDRLAYSVQIGGIPSGVLMIKPGDPTIRTFEDLRGKVVGTMAGYALTGELLSVGATPVDAPDDETGIQMLHAGRFDYLFAYASTTYYIVGAQKMSDVTFVTLRDNPYHVCFSRLAGDAEARAARFSAGFQRLKAEGEIERIVRSYGNLGQ